MTLVIALRAEDGLLLAADTRINEISPPRVELPEQTAYGKHGTKISVSANHSIMVASAEMDVASNARELIIDRLDSMESLPTDLIPTVEAACRDACNSRSIVERARDQMGTIVLVDANTVAFPILRTYFARYHDGELTVKTDFGRDLQLAGYSLNPACFFIEKYYQRVIPRPAHIEECVFLAGHTILTAGTLSSDRIQGIEIAICKPKTEPQFVQNETIKEVIRRSDALSKQIEGELYRDLNVKYSLDRASDYR